MSDAYLSQEHAIECIKERLEIASVEHNGSKWGAMIAFFEDKMRILGSFDDVLHRLSEADELRVWATETIKKRPAAHKEAELMLDLADEIERNIVSLYDLILEEPLRAYTNSHT